VHWRRRIVFDVVSLVPLGRISDADPHYRTSLSWKSRRGSTYITWGTSKDDVGDNRAIHTICAVKHMTVDLTFLA
jgi:hypothetical protein